MYRFKCGTYEQLGYWSNNFDDFASSLVVLWNLMVVNNWHVFLEAYTKFADSAWAQLYFLVWWLISVVVALNLFTAIILENFIIRWDRASQARLRVERAEERGRVGSELWADELGNALTVHDIFRKDLKEPSTEALMTEIRQHPYLQLRHTSH